MAIISTQCNAGRHHKCPHLGDGWTCDCPCHPDPDDDTDPSGDGDSTCLLCGSPLEKGNGDNWDGLDPECADAVSNYMDDHGMGDSERYRAIELVQHKRREDKDAAV